MILFERDWYHPENFGPDGSPPIVDTKTTNKSFLDYASLLHQMGIKNWAFCLALHDKSLQGLDPFSPELTPMQKFRIGRELEENPWYYLREVARVPSSSGAEPLRFRAHRANIGMFWLFMNNVSFFLLQPRQTGKSVVADMINNYLLHYRMHNSKTILVTLTQTLLSENIERIKAMRDLLPKYTIAKSDKDTKAKELYTYPARGNKLITKVSQNSPASANNVGRGCTTPVQQYDEGAFINFMDIVWPAATAATGAARDLARERGEPYGTIVTTTAGDKTTRSGRFMYSIYENSANWTERYFDLTDRKELHLVVKKNSKDGDVMVGATFNHLQLGFDDEWLREKIAALKTTDQDKINRDYFNVWTSGGALSPLSPEITQNIAMSERDPDYIQITKSGYIVKWYIPQEEISSYMANNHCIIGADTSEAVQRDATTFVVIDVVTLKTVCVLGVNEADVIKLSDFIVDFMVNFPLTTLIIERKSTAVTFIETLYTKLPLYGIDPFRRIYNNIVQDSETHKELFKEICLPGTKRHSSFYTKNKNKFGFTQTGNTRHILYKDVLQVAAKRCQHQILDKDLSNELRSLEVNPKSGRIDHTTDGHDDHVMSFLLAQWLLMYGKNLSFYGIDPRRIMMRVEDDGSEVDDSKLREQKLIEAYQNELMELSKKLAENEQSIYRKVLENRIRQLNNKLEFFGVTPKTIDSLIEDIKEQRKQKKRSNRMY